jgi:hypothetical protein
MSVQGGSTNDPQTVILRVLEESDYQSGEYVYQMVEHFVSQCRDTVNPFADVEGVLLDLVREETCANKIPLPMSVSSFPSVCMVYWQLTSPIFALLVSPRLKLLWKNLMSH